MGLYIVPEGLMDELYLENVLGLKKNGDRAIVQRVNSRRIMPGEDIWAYALILRAN